MKKSIFITTIFLILLLSGCGGSGGSKSGYHPPQWIQGSWIEAGIVIFEFTSDNVIQYGGGTPMLNFKDVYKDVTEESSSTSYAVTVNYGTATYKFIKTDENTLTFSFNGVDSMFLDRKTE